MRKLSVLLLTLLLLRTVAFSQKARPIDFTLPEPPKAGFSSAYRQIQVLDSRTDTSQFGFLSRSNEGPRPVIMHPDFQDQLMPYANPAASPEAVFLINLRRMEFLLYTHLTTEDAYCFYMADYYTRSGSQYYLVKRIDTLFKVVRESRNAKAKILTLTGEGIVGTLLPNLTQSKPLHPSLYTFNDIQHTDSMEKRMLPFYTQLNLRDGIYRTGYSLYL